MGKGVNYFSGSAVLSTYILPLSYAPHCRTPFVCCLGFAQKAFHTLPHCWSFPLLYLKFACCCCCFFPLPSAFSRLCGPCSLYVQFTNRTFHLSFRMARFSVPVATVKNGFKKTFAKNNNNSKSSVIATVGSKMGRRPKPWPPQLKQTVLAL